MKTKTQLNNQKTQDFVDRQMASEMFLLEAICISICFCVGVKWISRVFIAMFSRSIYIDRMGFKKVVVSGQHLLTKREG